MNFPVIKSIFIDKVKKLSLKDWMLIILGICVLCLGFSLNHYRNKSERVVVLNDSIFTYKNKLNEEYTAKATYIQTIEDLKKNNSELYNEVKNLKDNLITVTKTKIETVIDTVYAVSDTIIDNTVTGGKNLMWHVYEKNGFYSMKGNTWVDSGLDKFSTMITDIKVPATLTVDVIERNDGTLNVIGKTDNPYVVIGNIDGVMLDPTKIKSVKNRFKQKHWNIGPHIGVGVNPDLKVTPYIGIGVTYGIINF